MMVEQLRTKIKLKLKFIDEKEKTTGKKKMGDKNLNHLSLNAFNTWISVKLVWFRLQS